MRRAKFQRWLRKHGATFVRHGSKHDLWRYGDRDATIPRHGDIKPGTARAICEQLQLPIPPER